MKRIALALAFAALAGSASAVTVTIDFEELAVGQHPGDTYANYGIHFGGGTIAHNKDGNYVTGFVSVRFDSPINGLQYYGDGSTIDTMGTLCFTYGCEPFMIGSGSFNPTTGTGVNRDYYVGQTWVGNIPFPDLISVGFNTIALDNLRFTPPAGAPVNSPITATVPEPGSIALLGLGALGLLGARRRKAANSKNA